MEKKMETTIVYWGLYWDNGKENGNYYIFLVWRDAMRTCLQCRMRCLRPLLTRVRCSTLPSATRSSTCVPAASQEVKAQMPEGNL